ncbi:YcaO-like family protein [Streptomyces sp. NPDC020719]|uniref:YcaO-like family protein n=1 Tax=Streptomyces sp. NPDC020719 TaxID=3154896 RepID=UPI0033EB853A
MNTSILRLEGTVRARSPQDTWNLLKPRLADFGITRVARLTGLDCLGWPVWTAIRPAAQTLTATQGKGATDLLAKISAVMESIELWHAEQPPRITAQAPAARLDLPYPLSALPLHHDHPDLATVESDWVTCTGSLTGQAHLLPAGLIHRSAAPRRWEPDLWHTTSTGLACGNSRNEAVLHALFEVIERDVLAGDGPRPAANRRLIHPATVDDRYCQRLLDSLYQAGMEVEISVVEGAYGLPVCLAFVWSEDFPLWFAGSGCHTTASIALSRALSEAMQSRLTCIAGTRDDLPSHEEVFTAAPQTRPLPTSGLRSEWGTVMRDMPSVEGGFAEQVAAVARRVEKATGYEPLVVDLSEPASPIAAVKVVCPGTRSRITRAVPR